MVIFSIYARLSKAEKLGKGELKHNGTVKLVRLRNWGSGGEGGGGS